MPPRAHFSAALRCCSSIAWLSGLSPSLSSAYARPSLPFCPIASARSSFHWSSHAVLLISSPPSESLVIDPPWPLVPAPFPAPIYSQPPGLRPAECRAGNGCHRTGLKPPLPAHYAAQPLRD